MYVELRVGGVSGLKDKIGVSTGHTTDTGRVDYLTGKVALRVHEVGRKRPR